MRRAYLNSLFNSRESRRKQRHLAIERFQFIVKHLHILVLLILTFTLRVLDARFETAEFRFFRFHVLCMFETRYGENTRLIPARGGADALARQSSRPIPSYVHANSARPLDPSVALSLADH